MRSLAFSFLEPQLWEHVPIEDPECREVARRHYPAKIRGPADPDADGFVRPGERFLLRHRGPRGLAIWAIVRNFFREQWRFRNASFRNESGTLSSSLIIGASETSADLWRRRYHQLPVEPLLSEVDVAATAARRSKDALPGRCYEMAGWTYLGMFDPKHGRAIKAIWKAPEPWSQSPTDYELGLREHERVA